MWRRISCELLSSFSSGRYLVSSVIFPLRLPPSFPLFISRGVWIIFWPATQLHFHLSPPPLVFLFFPQSTLSRSHSDCACRPSALCDRYSAAPNWRRGCSWDVQSRSRAAAAGTRRSYGAGCRMLGYSFRRYPFSLSPFSLSPFLLSSFSFLLSPFSFLLSPFSFLLSPFSDTRVIVWLRYMT